MLTGGGGLLPHRGGHTDPIWNWPFALGSGKSVTPCARMHSANFTPLSRAVSFVLPPVPELLAVPVLPAVPAPVLPFSAEPLRTARADQRDRGKRRPAAIAFYSCFLSELLCRTCWSLLHPWIVRRVGVHRQGSRDRRPPGAARSARARCRRSGTARTRRRARTATPRHRRARCRPRPPTREQTCWGWPPIGRLPLLSRTSRPPHGVVVPGTPGNASHCRRRTRPRRPRHQLQPGAGHRADQSRGWLHPESRHRRPSCRRGRHRQPRQAHHGARCDGHGARRTTVLTAKDVDG